MRFFKKEKNQYWKQSLQKCLALFLCFCMILGFLPEILMPAFVKAQSISVASTTNKKIKNIIYMIPDGGGFGLYDTASAVKQAGGFKQAYGTKLTQNSMYMKDYLVGTVTTKSANNDVTDSAAAGTALATGHKTDNSYVGMTSGKKPVASILELAKMEGKATGVVVTKTIYDATPAVFASHVSDRADAENISKQMFSHNLDIVLGGGTSKVSDNDAKNAGYTLIGNETDLENAAKNATAGTKLWSTMNRDNYFAYESEYSSSTETPTLVDMTKSALTVLEKKQNGFFLMVEGSKIDLGGHANNAVYSSGEYMAFDEAYKYAVEWAKQRSDTIVVAVPDHDTGGLTVPTGSQLTSVVESICNKNNPPLTWESTNHSSRNVGVWMYVPSGVAYPKGFSTTPGDTAQTRNNYVLDNTDLAPYLADLISDKTLEDATNESYLDVTDYGTYDTGSGTFTFSSNYGSASVKVNASKATVNGTTLDLQGETTVYSNGRFYVSKLLTNALGLEIKILNPEEINGTGTKENPYIIASPGNFIKFTNAMIAGVTYEGKYFKQTVNIDMSPYSSYTGVGKNQTFKGVYDGQGHSIKVAVNSASADGVGIFPYIEGTIMNLGTMGSIQYTGDQGCGGIARSIRQTGKVINCWSTVDITSKGSAGGIAWTNYGLMSNVYYYGTLNVSNNNYGMAQKQDSASRENAYYGVPNAPSFSSEATGEKKDKTELMNMVPKTFNDGRESVANKAGVQKEALCEWTVADEKMPYFKGSEASLSNLAYSYTTKQGTEKMIAISDFLPDKTGYTVTIDKDMDLSKPVKLIGTALAKENTGLKTSDLYISKETHFGASALEVTAEFKNSYIDTKEVKTYSVNFSVTIDPNETEVPTQTPVITLIPTVTAVPTASQTPMPLESKVPVESVKPIQSIIPVITQTPEVTAQPLETEKPDMPSITEKPMITVTPAISKMPVETVNPQDTGLIVMPTKDPGTDILIPQESGIPDNSSTQVPAKTTTPSGITMKDCSVYISKSSYTYQNKAFKPKVVVIYGDKVLKKNADYKLSYKNNKYAGTAKIIIRGIGNYQESRSVNFKIKAKSILKLKSKLVKVQKYTGKFLKPTVSIKFGAYRLKKSKDYTITYKNNKKKGIATVYLKGKGNYTGVRKLYFRIK